MWRAKRHPLHVLNSLSLTPIDSCVCGLCQRSHTTFSAGHAIISNVTKHVFEIAFLKTEEITSGIIRINASCTFLGCWMYPVYVDKTMSRDIINVPPVYNALGQQNTLVIEEYYADHMSLRYFLKCVPTEQTWRASVKKKESWTNEV